MAKKKEKEAHEEVSEVMEAPKPEMKHETKLELSKAEIDLMSHPKFSKFKEGKK